MKSSIYGTGRARTIPRRERLGYPCLLFILWLAIEYCRPPQPMKIPLMISLVFLAGWLLGGRKLWNLQTVCALLFVAQMVIVIPFSENTYAARMVSREMFVGVVCVAVPVSHFITSLRQFDLIMHSWTAIFLYMAVVALLNGGNGPGGAQAGVDENYTALFMSVAISNIWFLSNLQHNTIWRVVMWGVLSLCAAAVVIGFSRGGFIGLIAVAGYCWWRSPNRPLALVIGLALIPVALALVPSEYWMEVNSITDTSESTADRRLTLWSIAVQMFLDNPILGVGPGNFPWESGAYQATDETGTAMGMNVTHSLYFELLAEMGTTGVVLMAIMVYANTRALRMVGRAFVQQRRRIDRGRRLGAEESAHLERLRRARGFGRGLAGSFLGFFACSAFLSTLYYTTFWLLTAMTIALSEATRAELASFRARQPTRRKNAPTAPAAQNEFPPGSASTASLLTR